MAAAAAAATTTTTTTTRVVVMVVVVVLMMGAIVIYTILQLQGTKLNQTPLGFNHNRGQSKCDGTCTETRFRLSAKWTSLFRSAGSSVQSTTGSRGVHTSSYCWE